MKLIVISDTHGGHRYLDVPDGDILIHCGDAELCDINRVHQFLEWFKEQPHKYKLFVPGNHDFLMQRSQFPIIEDYQQANIEVLIDRAITINNIKFYGTPWTPIFNNWAFMKSEVELDKIFRQIPKSTQVLITHGPSFHILDKTFDENNKYNAPLGSRALMGQFKRLTNLKAHVFGHIHGSYGNFHNSYNCSVLNEQYKLVNKATEIIIEA